jgi:hypothetical protein
MLHEKERVRVAKGKNFWSQMMGEDEHGSGDG